ncbi:MAG: DNA ligase D, partial [Bdellovibrionota bacterium]
GEVCWLDDDGHSHFSGLQEALKHGMTDRLVFFVFDILILKGEDLRERPLHERKEILKKLLSKVDDEALRYSDHFSVPGDSIYRTSCAMGLEGIISKRANSTYSSSRNGDWLKIKCTHGQEFVIGGYTKPGGSRQGFGALLLGAHDKAGRLRFVGKVGTGFDGKTLTTLKKKFDRKRLKDSPFSPASPPEKDVTWIEPSYVAQVDFTEWTSDGHLRHPVFRGMREDKDPSEVVIEAPEVKNVLSNPDKILFPRAKKTKSDLAHYYEEIAEWMLPHVANRPLSLVRCPHGAGAECFFQKHLAPARGSAIHLGTFNARERGDKEQVLFIDSADALTELVQLGVLEIHTWGSRVTDLLHPDLLVFDLDPDPTVGWPEVRDAAFELKDMLEALGLRSFVKTSGGKGVHLHVPIRPEVHVDRAKAFSKAVAQLMEREHPYRYTHELAKVKRKGKIFIDYLRNGWGSTAITAYSARAKPDANVALPITWKELKRLRSPAAFTIANAPKKVRSNEDPWEGYFEVDQRIPILGATDAREDMKFRAR